MTFAAPLFLLAALAAAIPVVLHMINRRKAKELPFSTLRFLKISVEKTRRRKRIHDVLLMALRAAVLLLIAAGLARPAVTNLGALWGGTHSAVVIILDNSASMGLIDQDRVRLDTATAAAAQILDQWTEGDQVSLLVACGPVFPDSDKLDRTQDAARQILGQCRVSYQRADLGAKVRQAQELLAKSESPNKQIYVLTDMQKLSWEGAGGGGREAGDEGVGNLPSPDQPSVGARRGAGGEGSLNESDRDKPQPALTLTLSQRERGPDSQPPIPNPQSPIPVILVDCNRAPKPNVAVQGVDLEAAAPVAGLPIKATVTLLNTSTVSQQPRVDLLIDGVKEASSPELNVPPEGRAKHVFLFALRSGGLHRGEVRLVGEDGSKYDDRRFFTMKVDQGIPVAIARVGRHEIPYLDDAYYLERALAPSRAGGWAVQTTTLTAGDLLNEPLGKYKVIFCVNLPALSAEAAERLRAYVAGGGNVMWICGDNVNAEAYNRMNEQAGGQLLPAPLVDIRAPGPQDNRDSWHIGFLDKKYPAFGNLVEPASLYESVLVYKHVRMAVGEGNAGTGPFFGGKASSADRREAENMDLSPSRVLARLDDGEPLLVLRNVEKGKVLMFGATVHVNWSNLPLRPIFLPLVARLTFDLAEAEQAVHNVIAGQPLVLRFPGELRPVGVEVVPPGGETLRLKTEDDLQQSDVASKSPPIAMGGRSAEAATSREVPNARRGQIFRYSNTYEIGIYLLRLLGAARPTPIAYSVNCDTDEADPATIERQELQERFGRTPLVFAENPDDLSNTFAWLREGKSLWGLVLTAVLMGLVFETFISNRLSPKQEDQEAKQPPPGMRRLAKKKIVD